jgi:hypothetical protein
MPRIINKWGILQKTGSLSRFALHLYFIDHLIIIVKVLSGCNCSNYIYFAIGEIIYIPKSIVLS